MLFFNVLTTICLGLLIGTELAVSVFINPVLQRLDTNARIKAISLFAKRLGVAMPFWYVASALLLLTQAALHRHDSGVSLFIASTALWLAVIVATLLFLVPINNRLMSLDSASSVEAALREHKRWDLLHRGRVAVLALSMALFLLAIFR